MSVKQSSKVWEWSKAEGNTRLVLLAIADFSDDDGYCYPGIPRIAKKCLISERTVQRCIRELRSMGELGCEEGGGLAVRGGYTSRYQVTVRGDNLTPRQIVTGDKSGAKVVTNQARSGDTAVSPKPSVHPSVKPSVGSNGSNPALSDEDWLTQLSGDSTYTGIDVRKEFGKMRNWCGTHNKEPTRRRFINWLNRADKPMQSGRRPDNTCQLSEDEMPTVIRYG